LRWVLLAIFALTYAGISAGRVRLAPIGRPATALVGATAMVGFGGLAGAHGLSLVAALGAIELHTIAMLFGTMVLSTALDEAGFFRWATSAVTARVRSPAGLLWAVTITAGLLSAVLVNDAVCLLATPVVLRAARATGAPIRPFVFALCMGANAGSAITLCGNPQNMLVARLSGLTYRDYLWRAGPAALGALLATAGALHVIHRRALGSPREGTPSPGRGLEFKTMNSSDGALALNRPLLVAAVCALVGSVAANLRGVSPAGSAMAGAALVLLLARSRAERMLARVDWNVLLFFSALFVLVAGLQRTGFPRVWLRAIAGPDGASGWTLVVALVGGSQVVSNVPLILLLEPWIRVLGPSAWTTTALVSTLAGNLTVLGSVANVIVIEQSGEPLGFREYLRVGVPVTVASMTIALWLLR
jgi:Na+/H+ antiporter NhaD/arsenite permease-like protein